MSGPVSIVVPAYNEEKAIAGVVRQLARVMDDTGRPYELLVVDDGSTDETASQAAGGEARVVSHGTNRGYGRALKTGIEAAQYDTIVITDADGTYPSEAIPKLLAHMTDHDMVVGARSGEHVKIPMVRRPAKWVLNQLANYLTGIKIPDLNSGLRAMRRQVLTRYVAILPDGFSFTATITLAMLTNGHRVRFVPIDYAERQGRSKFRPIRDTLNYLHLVIRTVMYFDPLKIFLPMGGLFLLASLTLIVYRLFIVRAFGVTAVVLFVTGIQLLGLGMIADMLNKRLR